MEATRCPHQKCGHGGLGEGARERRRRCKANLEVGDGHARDDEDARMGLPTTPSFKLKKRLAMARRSIIELKQQGSEIYAPFTSDDYKQVLEDQKQLLPKHWCLSVATSSRKLCVGACFVPKHQNSNRVHSQVWFEGKSFAVKG